MSVSTACSSSHSDSLFPLHSCPLISFNLISFHGCWSQFLWDWRRLCLQHTGHMCSLPSEQHVNVLTNKVDVDMLSVATVWFWIIKLSLLNMNKVSNHHPVTVCKWRSTRKFSANGWRIRVRMLHFSPPEGFMEKTALTYLLSAAGDAQRQKPVQCLKLYSHKPKGELENTFSSLTCPLSLPDNASNLQSATRINMFSLFTSSVIWYTTPSN